MAPRIRVSSISELKEFAGKDNDEECARSWLGKVKSVVVADQVPNKEKCLVVGDLLTSPARNWYGQLSRSTRCGYSRSSRRSIAGEGCLSRDRTIAPENASPLEYLHRLNVAGLRAKLPIKDGESAVRREHVEHFIETLDGRDLADQLALLRLNDAEDLEETLRARLRTKTERVKPLLDRKIPTDGPPTTPAEPTKTCV
ncbi:LOW QUALITY PROTEIN: hypothetical protein PHMEG_00013743 [Phytophthora megakarya]|uniref:Uncharacterized protein n=1 Tax=Phytophthora megakarya TaxID=4795 RepID=A0A225W607_9STRA|nr:LOW QUALITY PROTEIN: hypothetical protein PHMEG_00013743 [Phytophthora megakarya]